MHQLTNSNPYKLNNISAYRQWRDKKLFDYPLSLDEITVEVKNPAHLTKPEKEKLQQLINKTNMVVYATQKKHISSDFDKNKNTVKSLGEQFNLSQLDNNECADKDAITALQVNENKLHQLYIPYTNKAINWHTDGYYNKLNEQIYAFILHCVCPAEDGGENKLMDPEIAYIQLRDKNPKFISALMKSDAFLIPKNIIDGQLIRPDRSGPVFMFDKNNCLHMRYSARKKNVVWKNDAITQQAQMALSEIMDNENSLQFKGKLSNGQGLLCRNVLHTRSAFDDNNNSKRLLFRARFLNLLGYAKPG